MATSNQVTRLEKTSNSIANTRKSQNTRKQAGNYDLLIDVVDDDEMSLSSIKAAGKV